MEKSEKKNAQRRVSNVTLTIFWSWSTFRCFVWTNVVHSSRKCNEKILNVGKRLSGITFKIFKLQVLKLTELFLRMIGKGPSPLNWNRWTSLFWRTWHRKILWRRCFWKLRRSTLNTVYIVYLKTLRGQACLSDFERKRKICTITLWAQQAREQEVRHFCSSSPANWRLNCRFEWQNCLEMTTLSCCWLLI